MKRMFLFGFGLIALMLQGATVLADDAKPVAAPAVAANAKPAADTPKVDDPVTDAEKIIDDAVKKIDEDPGKQISLLIELAKSGRWGPFAGLLLLFLVWAFRKFLMKKINANVLPWLTVGLAAVCSIAVGLGFGNGILDIVLDTFITGGSATILWSMVFKHFMKPKDA